jgi:hypothetical protein
MVSCLIGSQRLQESMALDRNGSIARTMLRASNASYRSLALAFVLSGCASTSSVPDASPSPDRVAILLAADDNLIVPGERVGPVFLGMTEQQLYHKLGEPTRTRTAPGTVNYSYPTLQVDVDAVTHKVWEIDPSGSRYSTAEGVAEGSSSLAVRTQLVGPYSNRSVPGYTIHDYANGLTVWVVDSTGKVSGLSVWRPGHFHY